MSDSIGVLLKDKVTIQEVLISQATMIDNWYYLPYWFQIREDGSILCFHLNQLPVELKRQIENFRKVLNEKIKEKSE